MVAGAGSGSRTGSRCRNQFLGFGGTLLVDARDERDTSTYAAFISRAPDRPLGGHSQGVDPLVDEIGSFFARLMVPIDYQPEAEARIAAADPEALYAMFLAHPSPACITAGGSGTRTRTSPGSWTTSVTGCARRPSAGRAARSSSTGWSWAEVRLGRGQAPIVIDHLFGLERGPRAGWPLAAP